MRLFFASQVKQPYSKRIFSDLLYIRFPPGERTPWLIHHRLQVCFCHCWIWETWRKLQLPQLLLDFGVMRIRSQFLILLSLIPPPTGKKKKKKVFICLHKIRFGLPRATMLILIALISLPTPYCMGWGGKFQVKMAKGTYNLKTEKTKHIQ